MSGPYVVDVRDVDRDGEGVCCSRCPAPKGRRSLGESCNQNCGGRVVECALHFRRAFATLEEADGAVVRVCERQGYSHRDLRAISSDYRDRNRMVAPDGREIVVEATTWEHIADDLSDIWAEDVPGLNDRFLAAWNAEFGMYDLAIEEAE